MISLILRYTGAAEVGEYTTFLHYFADAAGFSGDGCAAAVFLEDSFC